MRRVFVALLALLLATAVTGGIEAGFGASIGVGVAAAQDRLDGTYLGIDDAAGARIRIAPDPGGFTGTFQDPQGRSQDFQADRVEDAAEAVLDMDGQTVLMRIAPLPFGAQVSIVPLRPDGSMAMEFSRSLGFVRQGVELPEKPDAFVEAPQMPGERVAGNAFVESYQFWAPEGVVNGYLGLPERFRTLLRMFPAVQLDVIWKLCLAPHADQALGVALRGQDVACPEVVETVARLQRQNRFDDYKAEVDVEREALQTSIRCADGYVASRATCDAAARRLAEAAVSLQTAGTVLSKFR
jgi:hypothetical protein